MHIKQLVTVVIIYQLCAAVKYSVNLRTALIIFKNRIYKLFAIMNVKLLTYTPDAEKVIAACEKEKDFHFMYEDSMSIREKSKRLPPRFTVPPA